MDASLIAAPGGFGPCFPAEILAAGFDLGALPFQIALDGRGVLVPAGTDPATRAKIAALVAAHDPAKPAAPAPTVTGNQWAFALGDLGLSAAWRAAVAKSKDKDQVRVALIARNTMLAVTDPLLIRVAANAGLDAAGKAVIDVAAVFAKALTEPT